MKGKKKHFVIDFVSRSGQLGRYCCLATSRQNAINNALVNSSVFPFYITKVIVLEYVYKLNH